MHLHWQKIYDRQSIDAEKNENVKVRDPTHEKILKKIPLINVLVTERLGASLQN